jgi:translation initiation factor IF-3
VDYGKYKYEINRRDREAKKHQHANRVKEIQITPQISPHDFGVKLSHAIDFLCEEMKVKLVLKFRGREMAHKEFGFHQIEKFTRDLSTYGHPDNEAKLVGKGVTVMFSPLPRNKRARNPRTLADGTVPINVGKLQHEDSDPETAPKPVVVRTPSGVAPERPPGSFSINPFATLDLESREKSPEEPSAG